MLVQKNTLKKTSVGLVPSKDKSNEINIDSRMTERRGTEELALQADINHSVDGYGCTSMQHSPTKSSYKSPIIANGLSNRNQSNTSLLKSLAGQPRGKIR